MPPDFQKSCSVLVCFSARNGSKYSIIKDTNQFRIRGRRLSKLDIPLKAVKKQSDFKIEKIDALNKCNLLATFSSAKTLFYTKALRSMFETFFEANSNSNIAIVIDKFEDLVLNFLSDLNMRKCHETNSYVVVMKKN